jgi:hypothetical protein
MFTYQSIGKISKVFVLFVLTASPAPQSRDFRGRGEGITRWYKPGGLLTERSRLDFTDPVCAGDGKFSANRNESPCGWGNGSDGCRFPVQPAEYCSIWPGCPNPGSAGAR